MLCQSKTLNPSPKSNLFSPFLPKFPNPFIIKILTPLPHFPKTHTILAGRREFRTFAGRSNKKPGGSSTGRIEGNADVRREAKRNARRKSKKLAENLFYRLKNPKNKNYPDNFTEEELQDIGLGYDRMVRFMDKDDPNLKHPYDWYKYGEFGPYSWRGVVLGEPIRGRFSDERVTLISEVRDDEEWEKIEQFEMAQDFGKRLKEMDEGVGFRHFWVFVRHPRWRVSELPWQQWTLVCEVVVEAGRNERLDKWSLMGRLGNKTRQLITQCAAWMRPDIVYVKRPVYQCRFEPQDGFFSPLVPLLDPETEREFLFQLEGEDGRVEVCTYFDGLCKIVKVSKKAFVDDVVKGYEKLSEERKSKCLEFLLGNHPNELLHPYTKEWKAKLEEMELGCDAPDDEDDGVSIGKMGNTEAVDWIEDYGANDDDDEEEEEEEDNEDDDQDDVVLDIEGSGADEIGKEEDDDVDSNMVEDEDSNPEESEQYWEEEFKKAMKSNEGMENIARRSADFTTKMYEKQSRAMEEKEQIQSFQELATKMYRKQSRSMAEKEQAQPFQGGDEMEMRRTRPKVSPEEWKRVGYGPWMKKVKKSRIPPELFLRAAVRPFTYRNLVKEIVLTRHAIVEGEIGAKK